MKKRPNTARWSADEIASLDEHLAGKTVVVNTRAKTHPNFIMWAIRNRVYRAIRSADEITEETSGMVLGHWPGRNRALPTQFEAGNEP